MTNAPRILLVPGSLRAGAFTTQLLVAAGGLFPPEFDVVRTDDIRALPHYDPDLEGADLPDHVRALRTGVSEAAGVLIATPEYNATVPGGLKDWVDWCTRPFGAHPLVGKPVAVIGASPSSRGATSAVSWLRTVLGFLGPQLVGDTVAIPNVAGEIAEDGSVSPEVTAQLQATVDALVAAVRSAADAAVDAPPAD